MNLDAMTLLGMCRTMLTIRLFEERVDELVLKGQIHGTTHLYIGMEAVAVGVCSALQPEDYITSTHRGHGHCIAKGADLGRMMAELLGRETGYCKGKGASMHIADLESGNLGATGIVGSGIPHRHRGGPGHSDAQGGPGGGVLLRGWCRKPGGVPREPQLGRYLEAPRPLRLREQPVRNVRRDQGDVPGSEDRGANQRLRHPRRHG
jgi:hypothetical protein